jgi:predicted HTH domain antitoxin
MTIAVYLSMQVANGAATLSADAREAIEYQAMEGFRAGTLSHSEASRMLGLSRFQFDGFLKDRHIHDHAYDVDDFVEDHETARCA